MTAIQVAVLTVSDTASVDAKVDKSGPAIRDILEARGLSCVQHTIVPDDILRIQNTILGWCKQGDIDWVVTTGGTGFGERDNTPEAVSALLERNAPGLVHLLLSASLQHTAMAALSRPVAGTIGRTLITTLPGSLKAVKENIVPLLTGGLVNHAIELIRGGSGREVHAELAAAGSMSTHTTDTHPTPEHHHHHHHHGHDYNHHAPKPRSVLSHDPSAAVSARHRISPYALTELRDALSLVETKIMPLGTHLRLVDISLRGHILATDIHAPHDVPLCPTTNVDGYAIRSTDPPGIYQVVTPQTHPITTILPEGKIYRINTGAPLPAGADAVIMVEDTTLVSTFPGPDGTEGEEKEVLTAAQVPAGENVRNPGSDIRKGELVFKRGEKVLSGGGEIGTLAFIGRKEVEVYRKPIVALLSTGNEIIDLHSTQLQPASEWGGIFDTNRPSLQAALEGLGYEVVDLGVVSDNVKAHVDAIKKGLNSSDILLTTGGTSMGPADLLKPIIEREFNGTIHFGRVAVKPGKPTTFATISFEGVSKPVFALPGNPASALVTFYLFVIPALRRLGGWPAESCQLPRVRVKLRSPMRLDTRTEFHRVCIRATEEGLEAASTGGQRSSRVASLSGANGLVQLPPSTPGVSTVIESGTVVEALVIGELTM